ncbi:MAG: Isopentenyl-diphosphate delta-isomerase [Gemmatimonadetes bacterium]|nr:Isopentenyl-diphosphate delta-isomerase [Gemmatimonadota bacterium]
MTGDRGTPSAGARDAADDATELTEAGAMGEERVVLVDPDDVETGTLEKMMAHREGALHRAFSVFVFDAAGRMLLQRRAAAKYHSGGLWSNTCCSHPRPGEDVAAAAARRLREEMGFACPLRPAFTFVYRADVGGGLTEHEYDHVLVGRFDGEPVPNPDEVEAWRWTDPAQVAREVEETPDAFTFWFRVVFREAQAHGIGV